MNMEKFIRVFDIIDKINEKIGKLACYSLLVIMLIQTMEVVLRYVFNSPTIWAWDINGQIFAAAGMIAGAYALLHDTHIRIDLLYRNWSARKKVIVDLLSYGIVLIVFAVVIWQGTEMAWWSWKTDEHANSYFAPILWPVKSCLPIAGFLIFIQGLSKIGRILISFGRLESENEPTI